MLFKWCKTFVASLSTLKISEKCKILNASRRGLNISKCVRDNHPQYLSGSWVHFFRQPFLEIAVYNNVRVHHATRGHRGSLAHVRLPRTKNIEKNFPQKTHRNTHDEEKRQEIDLTLRIWRFHGELVRGSLMRERFVS